MRRLHINAGELTAKAHERGFDSLDEVESAVLYPNGTIYFRGQDAATRGRPPPRAAPAARRARRRGRRAPPVARYIPAMPTRSTAFVTGATQGIGRATAFALGRAGYRVGVCARTAAKVEALVAELRAEGIEAAGAAADVADPEQVRARRRPGGRAAG